MAYVNLFHSIEYFVGFDYISSLPSAVQMSADSYVHT